MRGKWIRNSFAEKYQPGLFCVCPHNIIWLLEMKVFANWMCHIVMFMLSLSLWAMLLDMMMKTWKGCSFSLMYIFLCFGAFSNPNSLTYSEYIMLRIVKEWWWSLMCHVSIFLKKKAIHFKGRFSLFSDFIIFCFFIKVNNFTREFVKTEKVTLNVNWQTGTGRPFFAL